MIAPSKLRWFLRKEEYYGISKFQALLITDSSLMENSV